MPISSPLSILTTVLIFFTTCSFSQKNIKLETGDIIFQTSKSAQSKAIQLATNSKYSHVGIILEAKGKLYVFEAVQPVKMTLLDEWIKRGQNSHYVVKRPLDKSILTIQNKTKISTVSKAFIGKDYDIYFGWSNASIYCSELVWKIYKNALNIELCPLQQLKDFDLSNEIVKSKLKERYGDRIPMDEKVVSPSAIFNSAKLTTVIER